MKKIWADEGWAHYIYWQTQDRKTLKKINDLIRDIEREPYRGTGKPEALTGNWSGWWSRRIDDRNRIVYRVENGCLEIAQCKGHYGE
jgi:toxin YoeB